MFYICHTCTAYPHLPTCADNKNERACMYFYGYFYLMSCFVPSNVCYFVYFNFVTFIQLLPICQAVHTQLCMLIHIIFWLLPYGMFDTFKYLLCWIFHICHILRASLHLPACPDNYNARANRNSVMISKGCYKICPRWVR